MRLFDGPSLHVDKLMCRLLHPQALLSFCILCSPALPLWRIHNHLLDFRREIDRARLNLIDSGLHATIKSWV